jgi:catechol 2,3-dioxygenase-like lactoylglutathione lyase family enzyme
MTARRKEATVIKRLSHTTIWVLDQDQAHDFYVNKLGMEVRTDAQMGKMRWLTVGPADQPDLEISLMLVGAGPALDEETAGLLRTLVEKGALGAGVFETDDIQRDYEELKKKGVEFKSPPTEQFYGTEAIVKDPFGNWFSFTQHKPH